MLVSTLIIRPGTFFTLASKVDTELLLETWKDLGWRQVGFDKEQSFFGPR